MLTYQDIEWISIKHSSLELGPYYFFIVCYQVDKSKDYNKILYLIFIIIMSHHELFYDIKFSVRLVKNSIGI